LCRTSPFCTLPFFFVGIAEGRFSLDQRFGLEDTLWLEEALCGVFPTTLFSFFSVRPVRVHPAAWMIRTLFAFFRTPFIVPRLFDRYPPWKVPLCLHEPSAEILSFQRMFCFGLTRLSPPAKTFSASEGPFSSWFLAGSLRGVVLSSVTTPRYAFSLPLRVFLVEPSSPGGGPRRVILRAISGRTS